MDVRFNSQYDARKAYKYLGRNEEYPICLEQSLSIDQCEFLKENSVFFQIRE